MALTITDMATAVLEELGVLAAGETASAEDALTVQNAYKSWRNTAANRLIIDWYNDDEDIPDGAEHGVTLCVCNHVYRRFGVERDPSWLIEGEASLADYMHSNVPMPQTQVVNY